MMAEDRAILLVNRDERSIAWLRSHLEASGWPALAASSGLAALDVVRREEPALVILDLSPDPVQCLDAGHGQVHMDGFQFLRCLRLESDVSVIVVSRQRDEALKLYFLDSGADDYLTRPISHRELLARIRAVLRRTHQCRQRH
jgi:DNA-binding response OmpR family regulator